MGSRRSRRANGRVQAGPSRKPAGITKARKHAARVQQKAAILSAARTARHTARHQPPHLLALLALNPTTDARLRAVKSALAAAADGDATQRARFDTLIVPRAASERDTLLAALDAAKVADSFLLVFDGRADVDAPALALLDALRAQGFPSVNAVAIGDGADDAELRKLRGRLLATESLGDDHALRPLPARVRNELDAKATNRALLRRLFAKPPRAIAWRRRYGYMRVTAVEAAALPRDAAPDGTLTDSVALALRGFVRGRGFSPDELVHVTGFGSFAVSEIVDAATGDVLAARRDESGEPVESEAEPDETMGEQTWPPEMDGGHGGDFDDEGDGDDDDDGNEEEEEEEDDIGAQLAREYDAAADADNLADEHGDPDGDGAMHAEQEEEDGPAEDDDAEWAQLLGLAANMRVSGSRPGSSKLGTGSVSFSALGTADDLTVDADEVAQTRAAARTDSEFPDEVDTPIRQPARTRFARYRGLKSLRTGEWDPKEMLPRDYATLFQFRDAAATRKRVLARARREADFARDAALAAEAPQKSGKAKGKGKGKGKAKGRKGDTQMGDADADADDEAERPNFVVAGSEVVLHLRDVPKRVADDVASVLKVGSRPVVASGMLRHENRRSVVHFAVRRIDNGGEADGAAVVKAKAHLEMHVGFVRFEGRPMFSEHNANSDKHKMERFLRHGRLSVASFYGPAVYAPAPALLSWPGGGVVAAGAALGADPDRIMLKRIILTGYPFKTQKRRSVVRFMFFSPEDIRWFRPVELWTKMGRSGHIVEPLGTHGHMKCIFDNTVMHHDTVCMTLYKRVYPKLLTPADGSSAVGSRAGGVAGSAAPSLATA